MNKIQRCKYFEKRHFQLLRCAYCNIFYRYLTVDIWSLPSLTTMRLDITSGRLTPNATKVKAMIVSGICNVQPIIYNTIHLLKFQIIIRYFEDSCATKINQHATKRVLILIFLEILRMRINHHSRARSQKKNNVYINQQ